MLDGHGEVLSEDSAWDSPEASYQRKLEREYEQRIVCLLEPAVGTGAVIARVTAAVDTPPLSQNTEMFDPDQLALRSERQVAQSSNSQTNQPAGVAGAQANLPARPAAAAAGAVDPGQHGQQRRGQELRDLQDHDPDGGPPAAAAEAVGGGADRRRRGKPGPAEEIARLSELARKAVGFDEARGDEFEMTSQVFGRSPRWPR